MMLDTMSALNVKIYVHQIYDSTEDSTAVSNKVQIYYLKSIKLQNAQLLRVFV